MPKTLTRRNLLVRLLQGAGALAAIATLGGCNHTSTKPVTLAFKEEDAFYAALERNLNKKTEVIVQFDGTERIDSSASRFLAILKKAENGTEIPEKLHGMDTEAGRQKLSLAFGPALLRHEPTTNRTKIGNDVVEPGIIVLVAVTLLSSALATAVVVQAVKYKVTIDAEVPNILRFRCKPLA